MPFGPKITLSRKSGQAGLAQGVKRVTKLATYVGIPAAKAPRKTSLLAIAGRLAGNTAASKRKRDRAQRQASKAINNAEILFVNSKGSPMRGIPARPVLEPAVSTDPGKSAISHELAEAGKLAMANNMQDAKKRVVRAGIAGQNAARAWITDPRNGFVPNAPSTVKAKGSDRPLIDWGLMRAAIVHVEKEEK